MKITTVQMKLLRLLNFIKMVVLKPFYLELSKLVYAQISIFPIIHPILLL